MAANGNTTTLDGTIRKLIRDEAGNYKGFGFIRGSDGVDYFFHLSALPRNTRIDDVETGQRCRFVPTEPTAKGSRAGRVFLE